MKRGKQRQDKHIKGQQKRNCFECGAPVSQAEMREIEEGKVLCPECYKIWKMEHRDV